RRIDHLVVLMLENRSFDHVLGWMKRERPQLNGLTGSEYNPPVVGAPLEIRMRVTDAASWNVPVPFDPPHDFQDVTEHIFGVRQVGSSNGPGLVPSMEGFLACAARAASQSNAGAAGVAVLDGYAPGRLPAIHALAREYAICDSWFSSVPGPTWPNRFFAHCA